MQSNIYSRVRRWCHPYRLLRLKQDRKFVEDLADSLHLQWKTVQNDDGDRHLQLSFPPKLADDEDEDGEEDSEASADDESQKAILRVLQKYEKAKKKVASQRAVYKGGVDASRYGGEKTGISQTIKSVRL